MRKAIVVNILIAYVMFGLFAYFVSDKMIFVPPPATYHYSTQLVTLKSADGATIFGRYLPNREAKYTILLSHGNADDIGYTLPTAQALWEHGFSVFIYDYHGYGLSAGAPTEENAYADIDAAYSYLTDKLHIAPEHIIAYGHSLGAAITLDLAIRQPVAAVILEGAFITAFRVITQFPILPFDKFKNIEKIAKLKKPLLLIHGTKDEVVPFWHGKALYKKARQAPKQFYWVENGKHNNIITVAGEEYWQVLTNFFQENGLK